MSSSYVLPMKLVSNPTIITAIPSPELASRSQWWTIYATGPGSDHTLACSQYSWAREPESGGAKAPPFVWKISPIFVLRPVPGVRSHTHCILSPPQGFNSGDYVNLLLEIDTLSRFCLQLLYDGKAHLKVNSRCSFWRETVLMTLTPFVHCFKAV